jgi:hypothetical protein
MRCVLKKERNQRTAGASVAGGISRRDQSAVILFLAADLLCLSKQCLGHTDTGDVDHATI